MKKSGTQSLREWGKASLYVAAMLSLHIAASYATGAGTLENQTKKLKDFCFGDVMAMVFGVCVGAGAAGQAFNNNLVGAGKTALIAVGGSVFTSMISGGTMFNLLK